MLKYNCLKEPTSGPPFLTPFTLQFTDRLYRSTDGAIALTVHTTLSHLDKGNAYVGMLFVAFNTIVPAKIIPKLRILGVW